MSNTLFPKFALYRLRLLLELGARRQTLPAYLGSTVRGIFAASFRHVVCVTRAPVCDGCLLLHCCPYTVRSWERHSAALGYFAS